MAYLLPNAKKAPTSKSLCYQNYRELKHKFYCHSLTSLLKQFTLIYIFLYYVQMQTTYLGVIDVLYCLQFLLKEFILTGFRDVFVTISVKMWITSDNIIVKNQFVLMFQALHYLRSRY